MKIGFPVQQDQGVESQVYGHFGSAPLFIVVDTEGEDVKRVDNRDLNHVHGACNPVQALGGQKIEAIVVGGIGGGALMKLNAMGVKVYGAGMPTVKENIRLFKENKLQELTMDHSCKAHQGGCGH
ncbi:MAG TPA: NifB/NifX family molybdenum-iron cluster-binding protein [Thermodesulfobacteriota bacterium]|nr:NifB/NifX family molybdenum-iron cluster-binding protein [Thermodesulfobacteriota bacterium]